MRCVGDYIQLFISEISLDQFVFTKRPNQLQEAVEFCKIGNAHKEIIAHGCHVTDTILALRCSTSDDVAPLGLFLSHDTSCLGLGRWGVGGG